MSFCGSCGTDAGQSQFCPSCGAPTPSSRPRPTAAEMNSGQQPSYANTRQPATPWQAPAQPNSAPTSKSLGAAITLLVFAIEYLPLFMVTIVTNTSTFITSILGYFVN